VYSGHLRHYKGKVCLREALKSPEEGKRSFEDREGGDPRSSSRNSIIATKRSKKTGGRGNNKFRGEIGGVDGFFVEEAKISFRNYANGGGHHRA